MKFEIVLNTENATEEIENLNEYIREQNLKGVMTKLVERPPQQGEMSIGDYMPVIELLLGSTVVAAGVKGLFDIIKNYFDLQKEKLKNKTEQHKISFNIETDGKKVDLQLTSFDEKERQNFIKTIDKVLKK